MFPVLVQYTDYECFTLLLADQPGLEVLNEESVWIDAPPAKSAAGEEAFVINIGDMLEVLSAGTFLLQLTVFARCRRNATPSRCFSPAITTR